MTGIRHYEILQRQKRAVRPAAAAFFFCVAAVFSFSTVFSQVNDFGAWASVAVRHKITQRLTATVEEQIRLNQNATAVSQYFTDASLEFELTKKFKVSLSYRFINNYQETYFSKRHRVYGDLSYKTKFRRLEFLLRTRLQEQQRDIYSSDAGRIPEWHSRNKLTVKVDVNQRYMPYASAEAYFLLAAPNTDAGHLDKMRYMAGIEYIFNRVHALDAYYLIQQDYNVAEPAREFVFGVGYVFTF